LVFDQFEEIFAKKELAPLFESIRLLCSSVDAARENFVVGFAWKTDGTIPQDHPAYYMWHGLADRRREFSLEPFTRTDISNALGRFSKQLGVPVHPVLRRHLSVHCQGYPWLLKKLCIHVYDLVRSGTDQEELLDVGLNVKELFEKDMRELTPAEGSCLKRIAADSPAEFFRLAETYGSDTVQSLVNRRLVLHSGARLTLYWDIFRDYVLTGSVPNIPVNYIPSTSFAKVCAALRILLAKRTTTISELAAALGGGEGTAENIGRDLVMIGVSQMQSGRLSALQDTEDDSAKAIRSFLRSHIVIRHLIREKGPHFSVTLEEIQASLKTLYPSADFSDATWRLYASRIIDWLCEIGMMTKNLGSYVYAGDNASVSLPSEGDRRRIRIAFIGQAPPERVIEALQKISSEPTTYAELARLKFRNPIVVLSALGLVSLEGDKYVASRGGDAARQVVEAVSIDPIFAAIKDTIADDKAVNSHSVGSHVARLISTNWLDSSKRRYGNGMLRWVRWVKSSADS
jgi:hypothetical protein